MFSLKVVVLFAAFVIARSLFCFAEIQFTSSRSRIPNDTTFMNFDNLKIERANQSGYSLSGSFELFVDLGNDYEIVVILSRKSAEGSYDDVVFEVGPEKFCDYMQAKEDDDYGGSCAVPPKSVCPWPKQKIICNGFRSTAGNFQDFAPDDYMLEYRYSRNGKVLNGYQYYFTIIKN